MAAWLVPQYCAQKMWYLPDMRRREPFHGVAAGDDILLHPERRDKEIMNYILRGHRQLYWPAAPAHAVH